MALLMTTVALLGCDPGGPTVAPVASVVTLTLADSLIEVGQTTTVTATARDATGAVIEGGTPTYASEAPDVAAVGEMDGAVLGLASGTAVLTGTIDAMSDRRTVTVFVSPIRINEVNPDDGRPAGWVELYNPTAADIDMSDWTISSGDVDRRFTIPSGAVIPAGGFLAVNEVALPGGLKAADAVHLFSRWGIQADTYSWNKNPTASYARCPDGSGPFIEVSVRTRKATNDCGPSGG